MTAAVAGMQRLPTRLLAPFPLKVASPSVRAGRSKYFRIKDRFCTLCPSTARARASHASADPDGQHPFIEPLAALSTGVWKQGLITLLCTLWPFARALHSRAPAFRAGSHTADSQASERGRVRVVFEPHCKPANLEAPALGCGRAAALRAARRWLVLLLLVGWGSRGCAPRPSAARAAFKCRLVLRCCCWLVLRCCCGSVPRSGATQPGQCPPPSPSRAPRPQARQASFARCTAATGTFGAGDRLISLGRRVAKARRHTQRGRTVWMPPERQKGGAAPQRHVAVGPNLSIHGPRIPESSRWWPRRPRTRARGPWQGSSMRAVAWLAVVAGFLWVESAAATSCYLSMAFDSTTPTTISKLLPSLTA